jgi:secreted Zn-dependent insulinase-like peptidase
LESEGTVVWHRTPARTYSIELLRRCGDGNLHQTQGIVSSQQESLLVVLRSPPVEATAADAVKTTLLCELVKDALNDFAYDADTSELKYSFQSSSRGMIMSNHVYCNKMSALLMRIMYSLTDLDIKQDMFKI